MNRQAQKSFATVKNKYITIQEKRGVPDGRGGVKVEWVDIPDRIWCSLDPMRAVQRFEYKSISVEATHFVKTDGYNDIKEDNRLKYNNRVFEILTIENIQERDFELFITCKERR